MQAVVLSIGSELLRGDIVDTNAAYLTRGLSRLGFRVHHVEQIGDDLAQLTDAVRDALAAAEVVVCTGGLGPTQDDLTRDAISAALGEEMFTDPELVAQVEARFASLRRAMPASNLRQALRIPSAEAIPNPNGTAPGWWVGKNGRIVAAMPGPPGEMVPMWEDQVEARLARLLPGVISMRALITFGLGESAVEHRLRGIIGRRPDVVVATYAKAAGVEVHITAHADSRELADALVADTDAEIRGRLGDAVYGTGTDTLSSVIGRMVAERGLTIGVMESATGGELASTITNNPGSSDYFVGGMVAYTREAKASFGVEAALLDAHGLISADVGAAMARAARRATGARVGLGTTGVAGTEAVEGKPPGTCFVAVSLDGREEVREIHRPASREVAKRFFALCALDLLRRVLADSETSAL